VGYRLDWPDRSLAYVTDTTAATNAAYVPKIRGVDLLVHECYFDDTMIEQAKLTGHSCLTEVCRVARKAQVGMLLLTHINPLADETHPLDTGAAKKIFPEIFVAEDGMVVEF
jgi:ribonuclease BN (tRNA processing enzyme)